MAASPLLPLLGSRMFTPCWVLHDFSIICVRMSGIPSACLISSLFPISVDMSLTGLSGLMFIMELLCILEVAKPMGTGGRQTLRIHLHCCMCIQLHSIFACLLSLAVQALLFSLPLGSPSLWKQLMLGSIIHLCWVLGEHENNLRG